MHTDTLAQKGKDVGDLGKVLVVLGQLSKSILEHLVDHVLLIRGVELHGGTGQGHLLALSLAEVEDDDRLEILFENHLDDLCDIRLLVGSLSALVRLLVLALALLLGTPVVGIGTLLLFDHGHCLVEVILLEITLLVDNEEDTLATGGEEVVLQGRRTEIGVDDVAGLTMDLGDPFGELEGVGNGGGEEDVSDLVGKQDDGLFPDNTSNLVAHVMDFIEDDPGDFAHDFGTAIQHGPQNFGRHDETTGCGINGNITSHEANVTKLGLEVSVLLVGKSLDGTRVDDPLVLLEALGNGVFGNDRLTSRGMGGNQDTLFALNRGDGEGLEGIELEGVCSGGLGGGLVLGQGDILVVKVGGKGDLMLNVVGDDDGLALGGRETLGAGDLSGLCRLEGIGHDGLGLVGPLSALAVALAMGALGRLNIVGSGRGIAVGSRGLVDRVVVIVVVFLRHGDDLRLHVGDGGGIRSGSSGGSSISHFDIGRGLALLLSARLLLENLKEVIHLDGCGRCRQSDDVVLADK